MNFFLRTAAVAALLPLTLAQFCPEGEDCTPDFCEDCATYGVDFLEGGSYFQNSESSEPFTALQEFEGCSNGTSNNVLVDPNGEQYECTESDLSLNDVPQLITCPVEKDELFDGEWSFLILSNNGDCDPIANQREFLLSVGPQQSTTVSPTVVLTSVTSPIATVISTLTEILTKVANPSIITVPRVTIAPTVTKRPLPAVKVVTKAILTVTKVQQIPRVTSTKFITSTAKCTTTRRRRVRDPVARIAATILGDLAVGEAPAPTARSGTTEFKRAILEGRAVSPAAKERFLIERRERLALVKRAPDVLTTTITDADGTPVTSTVISTAPEATVTGSTTLLTTTTTTPTVTVKRGIEVTIVTVTAPQRTLTLTDYIPLTTKRVTKTVNVVMSVTETVTPAGASASCAARGGILG